MSVTHVHNYKVRIPFLPLSIYFANVTVNMYYYLLGLLIFTDFSFILLISLTKVTTRGLSYDFYNYTVKF